MLLFSPRLLQTPWAHTDPQKNWEKPKAALGFWGAYFGLQLWKPLHDNTWLSLRKSTVRFNEKLKMSLFSHEREVIIDVIFCYYANPPEFCLSNHFYITQGCRSCPDCWCLWCLCHQYQTHWRKGGQHVLQLPTTHWWEWSCSGSWAGTNFSPDLS